VPSDTQQRAHLAATTSGPFHPPEGGRTSHRHQAAGQVNSQCSTRKAVDAEADERCLTAPGAP
jgi:hypothetical protein